MTFVEVQTYLRALPPEYSNLTDRRGICWNRLGHVNRPQGLFCQSGLVAILIDDWRYRLYCPLCGYVPGDITSPSIDDLLEKFRESQRLKEAMA